MWCPQGHGQHVTCLAVGVSPHHFPALFRLHASAGWWLQQPLWLVFVLSVPPGTMFLVSVVAVCFMLQLYSNEPVQMPATGNNMQLHRRIQGAIQLRVVDPELQIASTTLHQRHIGCTRCNNSSANVSSRGTARAGALGLCCVHASSPQKSRHALLPSN